MSSKKRSSNESENRKKIQKNSKSHSDSHCDGIEDVENIQIDVSGFELAPSDFNGIQLLLQQVFLKTHINISELTSFLIDDQLDVGCVIKETEIDKSSENNDEDTVFGVISVVHLSQKQHLNVINQLRSLFVDLSKQHATEKTRNFVTSLFNTFSNLIGLLINERYSNLPSIVSVSSLIPLTSEIENKGQLDSSFRYTHFVMICKLNKIKLSKNNKHKNNNTENETIWINPEEEIFDKYADARFEYSVKSECDTALSGSWTQDDVEMIPYRRILIFASHKLTNIINEINDFVK